MAGAGHETAIKISGTAASMTGEATTSLGSNRYQITDSAKRIVSPNHSLTVKDGGSPVAASGYSFDYLFGVVTFVSPPAGAVTIDGYYVPTQAMAEVKGFRFKAMATILDVTTFDSTGYRSKLAGLKDSEGSLDMLVLPTADLDAVTGGTQSLWSYLSNGTARLLEASFEGGGTGKVLRAWVVLENVQIKSEVDGLVEVTADFQGAQQAAGAAHGFTQYGS